MNETYTTEGVKAAIERDRDRLFAPYAVGRPENWACDTRTKDLICLSVWLDEELRSINANDADRKTQCNLFNRWSRSDENMFELVAFIMNETLAGRVEQNRKPHRRWG